MADSFEGAKELVERGDELSMRIALLSYRSKTHCGGQGVYVRHLSHGLVELGHDVEVFSGQPYPDVLDPRVRLTKVPSLDLYREPDPFRVPWPSEIRTRIDLLELATMGSAGFPEPRTFSLRAARLLADRTADFDVVHDNQSLGSGLLKIAATGLPVVATVHHPITRDRILDLAAAPYSRSHHRDRQRRHPAQRRCDPAQCGGQIARAARSGASAGRPGRAGRADAQA